MIPGDKYYVCSHFPYITEALFKKYHTEKEWKIFNKWMRGQTVSEVNGEMAIYSWDYERWVEQGKKTEQGEDWD